jgi:tripartite-type tricarboxylate transporter receptor subunit TctC
MAIHRRRFLQFAGSAAALSAAPAAVAQGAYPNRPIKIVVGFAPGGGQDILARLVAGWLTERLGQQVIIETKPGQSGSLGAESVVRAPADGYTLFLLGPNNAINATFYSTLSFDVTKDLQHVAAIATMPNVMAVHPSVPAKTVAEFIAYAKAKAGKGNYASGGVGTSVHVSGEMFKQMTGVEMQHVTYRGAGPATIALLAGGQVDVMFDNLNSQINHIKEGRLRALGVTSAKRIPALPDVPTVAETVPGFEAMAFFGISAPRNIPPAVLGKLNSEINAGLRDPKLKARIEDFGADPSPGTPEAFTKLVADETAKWAKVLKAGGIKAE